VPAKARDLLEIGCGQGGFAVRFARRFSYVGIDLDETSVSVARRRIEQHGTQGDVRLGDLSVLAPDETFDVVCAFEVLEHLEEDASALREWAGRLRPGGTLVVSVPAGSDRYAAWDELAGHYRRYDPPSLLGLLAGAGLTGGRATVYGWPAGYALEALRNGIARRRGTASAGGSFEERTSASGRLLSLPDGPRALVPYLVTRPFALLQRLQTGRGTGLVASAHRPY
jgi:SAM-dependent methyltransferase